MSTGVPADVPASQIDVPMAQVDEDEPRVLPLADGFAEVDLSAWEASVAKVLNRGRPQDKQISGDAAVDRLQITTVDGVPIDCLYTTDVQARPIGHPGVMPFTRGSGHRPTAVPWGVRGRYDDPDVGVTRRSIMTDLEHGVTSLWLEVGEHAVRADELGLVLADVLLDLAPICVGSAGGVGAQVEAAQALLGVWRDRGLVTRQARGHLGHDPIGAAARTGRPADPDAMVDAARACAANYPGVGAVSVDLRPYHDAGAGDVDEVAFALATGVEYLRALEAGGLDPATAVRQLEFRLNATTDQFLTIAKLRALRRAWARVAQECGVPEPERGARIHAVTSYRMMSRDDPYVNVLRGTTACFGAAVGGADAITVLPFDTVAGLPEDLSRRIARNTQILLAEESNVGRVLDPAGGSWYVETLTDEIARRAWSAFGEIEARGGMARALADGDVEARLAATTAERDRRLARRTLPLTGVSMFPQVDEQPLMRVGRLEPEGGGLPIHRDAEMFERLRDRSTAHVATTGSPPEVFLACLGARRDFGARETFTSAFLAVAGLSTPRSEGGTPQEIGERAARCGARVAVLCSSTARYAEEGAQVAQALRAGGVERLYIAGRASELGDHADCVDDALGVGVDVVAVLTQILDLLGAPGGPTGAADSDDTIHPSGASDTTDDGQETA